MPLSHQAPPNLAFAKSAIRLSQVSQPNGSRARKRSYGHTAHGARCVFYHTRKRSYGLPCLLRVGTAADREQAIGCSESIDGGRALVGRPELHESERSGADRIDEIGNAISQSIG